MRLRVTTKDLQALSYLFTTGEQKTMHDDIKSLQEVGTMFLAKGFNKAPYYNKIDTLKRRLC